MSVELLYFQSVVFKRNVSGSLTSGLALSNTVTKGGNTVVKFAFSAKLELQRTA